MTVEQILGLSDLLSSVIIVIVFVQLQMKVLEKILTSVVPVLEASITSSDKKWELVFDICAKNEKDHELINRLIDAVERDGTDSVIRKMDELFGHVHKDKES